MNKNKKINKKAIISTILVAQLVFMTLLAMTTLKTERDNFVYENQYSRIAAHKLRGVYDDVAIDVSLLRSINTQHQDINNYIGMVNSTTTSKFLIETTSDITLDSIHIIMNDPLLEMVKEGDI